MAKKKASRPRTAPVIEQEEVVEIREFTKAELFYIEKRSGIDSLEQIAEALGVAVENIIAIMPKKNNSRMNNLMGKKPRYGTVVMTPAAAMLADENRINKKNNKEGKHIYKPYGDE